MCTIQQIEHISETAACYSYKHTWSTMQLQYTWMSESTCAAVRDSTKYCVLHSQNQHWSGPLGCNCTLPHLRQWARATVWTLLLSCQKAIWQRKRFIGQCVKTYCKPFKDSMGGMFPSAITNYFVICYQLCHHYCICVLCSPQKTHSCLTTKSSHKNIALY